MKLPFGSAFRSIAARLTIFPLIMALGVLIFMVWTVLLLVEYPDDGIDTVENDGYVAVLSPEGPAMSKLEVGDVIERIEGMTWDDLRLYYPKLDKSSGDPVEFMVERQGQVVPVIIYLVTPTLSLVATRFVPVLVAFVFWFVGLGVAVFKPVGRGAQVYFLWFQASAVTLTLRAGAVGSSLSR